jgi:chromosomal replication initiator protein
LEISVPNSFAKEYIESRFKPLLEQALDSTLGTQGMASS